MKIADYQRDQYFAVRKYQAAAAGAALDWREVQSIKQALLSGNADVTAMPAYQHVVSQLRRVRDSDKRIRFAYIYFPIDPENRDTRYMVFLADAENPTSQQYSAPGQTYTEALPVEYQVFTGERKPEPIIEPKVKDQYGHWTSALISVRVTDGDGKAIGMPIALMGTDVDVNQAMSSFNQIRYLGLIYSGIGALLLALVLLQWIIWGHGRDKREEMRLEMEDSILRLNEELVEADRLKSEFIESASHELRGPVTAVDGALSVLDRHLEGELDDPGEQLMDIAKSGSTRLANLVNNLLDVTRIEAGGIPVERGEVDAGQLVRETVRMFEVLAEEKGLDLTAELPEGETRVYADPDALRRVLENLINNAINYTDAGSVTVSAEPVGDVIRFKVKDTGRGIPEKFQDEAFKKFSRLHLSTESTDRGAGLGLSISKGIVSAHGGCIWVESEEGKGSSFIFEIPRKEPPRPQAAKE